MKKGLALSLSGPQTMRGKKRQYPYSGYQKCAQLELEYSVNITTDMLQINMFVYLSLYYLFGNTDEYLNLCIKLCTHIL